MDPKQYLIYISGWLTEWADNGLTVTGDRKPVTCYGWPLEHKLMEGRASVGKWADNGLIVTGDPFRVTCYELPLEATPLS